MYKKILKIFITLFVVLCALSLWFNRTPQRHTPRDQNIVVSPANGKVIAIIKEKDKILSFFKKGIQNNVEIPSIPAPYTAIVIEMNITNIHAQRAPIDGTIVYQKHIPGRYKNAVFSKNKEYLAQENEKTIQFFKNEKTTIGVIQVAGILARRIQSFKHTNDTVHKGEIFGRIVLGSQVVVVVPDNIDIQTHIGDALIDGESVIGKLKNTD